MIAPTDDSAERDRLVTVLLTVAVSAAGSVFFATRPWSDGRTAVALNAANALIFGAHLLRRRGDPAVVRLLLFGLALGVVELVADWLCVRFTGTLDYTPARSALLWASPWWMPLAWMMVGTQVGYLGARFVERVGVVRGALLSALCGACLIPFYEEMAYYAHWWRYVDCKKVGHTPLYIIAAEAVIGLALGPLARLALREPSWRRAVLAGALAGLSTIIGGLIGYGLMERIL
jgi:hypothetical protein